MDTPPPAPWPGLGREERGQVGGNGLSGKNVFLESIFPSVSLHAGLLPGQLWPEEGLAGAQCPSPQFCLIFSLPPISWVPSRWLTHPSSGQAGPCRFRPPVPAHEDSFLAGKTPSASAGGGERWFPRKGPHPDLRWPLPGDQQQPSRPLLSAAPDVWGPSLTADGRVCHNAWPLGVSPAISTFWGMWLSQCFELVLHPY